MPTIDSTSILAVFTEDHERLLALLDELLDVAPDESPSVVFEQLDRFCRSSRLHMAVEDQAVFPRFEEKTGLRTEGPTALLRREHQQIEARLTSIETAFKHVETVGETLDQVRALRALFEDHRRREEEILFPACDRLLDSDQRHEVVCALRGKAK